MFFFLQVIYINKCDMDILTNVAEQFVSYLDSSQWLINIWAPTLYIEPHDVLTRGEFSVTKTKFNAPIQHDSLTEKTYHYT